MTDDPGPPKLTRLQRQLIDAAVEIEEVCPESPEFLHSVLCQVGLPRRKTNTRFFERSNGKASIAIEAGRLHKRGQWVEMPLPYGAKPRLTLIHITSEAKRTGSGRIEIGSSTRDFLLMLGLDTNGRAYAEMMRQMEALSACRMMIGLSTGTRDITIDTKPIDHFEAWLHRDGFQRSFWPGYLELSPRFLETLCEHAVPLDPRALRALQKSAFALDIYTWLAHRLCRIRNPEGVKVSWRNLKSQFGQEYKVSKDFKNEFKAALFKAHAVYPAAKIEYEPGGLRLYSSPPPIPKSQVLVLK